MMEMMGYTKRLGVVLLLVLPQVGWGLSYGFTDQEKKMLPGYCTDPDSWRERLGEAIVLNNHTCYALDHLNKYYKNPGQKGRLSQALADFNYSVRAFSSKPDFPLLPEIYAHRGTTLALMGRNGEAAADFMQAIKLDPKFVKAYVSLADLYEQKLSRKDKALETVTEGLKHNPDIKALQRRYDRLSGKKPYPEPYADVRAKPHADGKSVETPAPEAKPGSSSDTKPEQDTKAAPASAAAKEQSDLAGQAKAATSPPAQADTQTIGSPDNPYCRFCPTER